MSGLSIGLTRVVGHALLHFSMDKKDTAYPRYAHEFCGSEISLCPSLKLIIASKRWKIPWLMDETRELTLVDPFKMIFKYNTISFNILTALSLHLQNFLHVQIMWIFVLRILNLAILMIPAKIVKISCQN